MFRQKLGSSMILSCDRAVRSWSIGSSYNLMRTDWQGSDSGMMANNADTSAVRCGAVRCGAVRCGAVQHTMLSHNDQLTN